MSAPRRIWTRGSAARALSGSVTQSCKMRVRARRANLLAVNHAAARGHPGDVSRVKHPFVAVVERPVEHERDRLEARVRVRSTDSPTRREVQAIVHQEDEGIGLYQRVRRDHFDGGVTRPREARLRGRRAGVAASASALSSCCSWSRCSW